MFMTLSQPAGSKLQRLELVAGRSSLAMEPSNAVTLQMLTPGQDLEMVALASGACPHVSTDLWPGQASGGLEGKLLGSV